MHIIALSDTHNQHSKIEIPPCDILIHAGDASNIGKHSEIASFLNWYSRQPAKYKVFVAGNHDRFVEEHPERVRQMCEDRGISLLMDEGVELDGVKVWGSPIQPYFCNWAFNRWPGDDIQKHWDLIPKGLDILVTHGPPYGFLDGNKIGRLCGCNQLFNKVMEVQPKAHIFGHIHDNNGLKSFDNLKFYNVAVCDEQYRVMYKPMEINL